MVGMVWHDDKENKVGVLDSAVRGLNGRQDLLVVVVLNAWGKSFQKILFVNSSFVRNWADICVLNSNVETLLGWEIKELVIDIVSVLDILLKADDGKLLESLGLMDHGVEAVRIV